MALPGVFSINHKATFYDIMKVPICTTRLASSAIYPLMFCMMVDFFGCSCNMIIYSRAIDRFLRQIQGRANRSEQRKCMSCLFQHNLQQSASIPGRLIESTEPGVSPERERSPLLLTHHEHPCLLPSIRTCKRTHSRLSCTSSESLSAS